MSEESGKGKLIDVFLIPALDSGAYGQLLKWEEREKGIFKLFWLHKASKFWKPALQSVFTGWDLCKGRYRPFSRNYYVKSKQRFRAALLKSPRIQELTEKKNTNYRKFVIYDKGTDARRQLDIPSFKEEGTITLDQSDSPSKIKTAVNSSTTVSTNPGEMETTPEDKSSRHEIPLENTEFPLGESSSDMQHEVRKMKKKKSSQKENAEKNAASKAKAVKRKYEDLEYLAVPGPSGLQTYPTKELYKFPRPRVVDISRRKPGTQPVIEKATPKSHLTDRLAKPRVLQGKTEQCKEPEPKVIVSCSDERFIPKSFYWSYCYLLPPPFVDIGHVLFLEDQDEDPKKRQENLPDWMDRLLFCPVIEIPPKPAKNEGQTEHGSPTMNVDKKSDMIAVKVNDELYPVDLKKCRTTSDGMYPNLWDVVNQVRAQMIDLDRPLPFPAAEYTELGHHTANSAARISYYVLSAEDNFQQPTDCSAIPEDFGKCPVKPETPCLFPEVELDFDMSD